MIPRIAIEKAIEGEYGGYSGNVAKGQIPMKAAVEDIERRSTSEKVALDPLFWQALGKALGWGYKDMVDPTEHYSQEEWQDKAHDFYDLILDGYDPELFWQEVLK